MILVVVGSLYLYLFPHVRLNQALALLGDWVDDTFIVDEHPLTTFVRTIFIARSKVFHLRYARRLADRTVHLH